MKDINELTRPNILSLDSLLQTDNRKCGQTDGIFLDANENPYNFPWNRYTDSQHTELKKKISRVKKIPEECIFTGSSSDGIADLLYRCFAEPKSDNVVAIEPTYGAYKTLADINGVEYRPVRLGENFRLSAQDVLSACDGNTKMIWLCSPNDPTGNELQRDEVVKIITGFEGLVVVDEAYSDFSAAQPLRHELYRYPNLIVLDTFSKAWGCAGIRLGLAYAFPDIIDIIDKVKLPYGINAITQEGIMKMLDRRYDVDKWKNIIIAERERMTEAFRLLPSCEKVYPSDANFFLARMTDATAVYSYLKAKGIMVKDMAGVTACENCLRITIGSKTENSRLLAALRLPEIEE